MENAIWYTSVDTPIGPLWLAATPTGILRIQFNRSEASFRTVLHEYGISVTRDAGSLGTQVEQLTAYFEDAGNGLRLSVDWERLVIPAFYRAVLEETVRIPCGQTVTYGEIAQALRRPRAAQAVGRALAANPVPLVVPCHRVVGADGSLRGYAGGLDVKSFLLRHEGALLL